MPWHISENHPDCSGFAVVKDDDGSLEGCHPTKADAEDQMAALYASEDDAELPSGMVAAVPRSAETLAVDGGDAASELHVTLRYFEGELSALDRRELRVVVNRLAEERVDFEARVSGVGTLGDEGAVVLFLEAEELNELREELEAQVGYLLSEDGHPGYVPHLTLGYGLEGLESLDRFRGTTVRLEGLRLVYGDEEDERFVFNGGAESLEVEDRVAVHHTETVEGTWDGPANEARLPSPMTRSVASRFYAALRVTGDEVQKQDGALGHHRVDGDGNPGPAVLNGVRNALARLSGTQGISDAERESAERHLQAHIEDGGSGDEDDDRAAWAERVAAVPVATRQVTGQVRKDHRYLPAEVRDRLDEAGADVGVVDRAGRGLFEMRFEPELRQNEDGTFAVHGYATVYGFAYDVLGGLESGFGWVETIEAGAADRSVRERDDVRFLVNHEGLPLARTRSGTLTVTSDDIGLYVSVPRLDPRSPSAAELVSALEREDVDEMSFAFRALRDAWNEDFTERVVREVMLFDVSAVTWPANPAAVIKLRRSEGLALSLAEAELELLDLK